MIAKRLNFLDLIFNNARRINTTPLLTRESGGVTACNCVNRQEVSQLRHPLATDPQYHVPIVKSIAFIYQPRQDIRGNGYGQRRFRASQAAHGGDG